MTSIELTNVSKTYKSGEVPTHVLHKINLAITKGDMVAIMGPSGSGKSTLMNIIGLLDRPTHGKLTLDGQELNLSMSDAKLAGIRSQKIGFVFQSFNLLPRASALVNVLMPTTYNKVSQRGATERARQLLEQVGLGHRIHHKPSELSGGEKQRVAIARALINNPEIILADEPTGNLDSESGAEILAILKELNQQGKTLIIITHDQNVARQCRHTIHIQDGKIKEMVR